MKMTKLQREELKTMSYVLYGTTSKWQKIVESGAFDIPVEKRDEPYVPYVKIGKTIWRYAKALNRGLIKPVDSMPVNKTRTLYRKPSPSEVYYILTRQVDEARLRFITANKTLDPLQKKFIFAYKLANYTLDYPWNGLKLSNTKDTDEYNKHLEEIKKELPEDLIEDLNALISDKLLSTEVPESTIGIYDTVLFFDAVNNILKNFGEATDQYQKLIHAVDGDVFNGRMPEGINTDDYQIS